MMNASVDRARGVLLGGMIGDALGNPVEFVRGPAALDAFFGIEPALVLSSPLVTDDTQMTFFTVEALIAYLNESAKTLDEYTHESYLRWLATQGHKLDPALMSGWLRDEPRMMHRRAPGNTCLSALASNNRGSIENRINDSMGCGGVMRTAPIGLVATPHAAFEAGCANGAITHGHDNGIAPSGAVAMLIASLTRDVPVDVALREVEMRLRSESWGRETADLLDAAAGLATEFRATTWKRTRMNELLGEGWVGHEALAIAVCCALTFPADPARAIWAAANHPGDSDSTASITGQLFGAAGGLDAIPPGWVATVEMTDVALRLATDLFAAASPPPGGGAAPEPHT
jgi:ADP-ribosylglycohydrolase